MMKRGLIVLCFLVSVICSRAQVDTTYIYNSSMPYGTLDIRLAKSDTRYYYLKEGETFSFRENAPGVRTGTFTDMTSWDSSPFTEGNLREKAGDQDLFTLNYRLMKPVDYKADNSKGYPLVVLFHGAGERANCWKSNCYHADPNYSPNENIPPAPADPEHKLLNNDHNLLHGGRQYMEAVTKAGSLLADDPSLPQGAFPGFALFPQSQNGWTGNEAQDVIRIIRLLVKKYNIDPDRIYLSGLSYGGHGAFEALKRAPWMFAAGILMSPIDDGFITNTKMESSTAHVPLWIFQGGLDNNPYPAETKNYIKKFRDAGAEVRYSEFPEVGHTVWNNAFKEPDYFSWLLQHSKSTVHMFAGSNSICDPSEGRQLELPEGFMAYQWEKDGQIIDGATGARYVATTPGRYRARFSRVSATPDASQWNEWSPEISIVTGSVPVASVKQIGTLLLRDLNNGNEARLEAGNDFAHYYWYKNGVQMNFPGDQDDTLKMITIRAGDCSSGTCTGNAVYTLVAADFDNCKSAPTEGKHVFFNNQAPTNITAPTEFQGTPKSTASVSLTWKDNAANETGYEVWHRRKVSDSRWEMPAITPANATSYEDTGLLPGTIYQYKIRAVSSSGRSPYAPSAETVLEVATQADVQAPAAPANLTFRRIGVDRILLRWEPATDDSGVARYIIVSTDTMSTGAPDTTIVVTGLEVDKIIEFKVAAVDVSGNISSFGNTVSVNTGVYGLFYEHSPGDWTSLDSIDYSRPEHFGSVGNFSLAPRVQEDFYYFRFDGYLFITNPGEYQFRLSSDDGSRMVLNGNRIVNNDGVHELRTVTSAAQSLSEGPQRITVDFFDYSGEDSLLVEMHGPDTNGEWRQIEASALKSATVVGTEPAYSNAMIIDVFPNPADQSDLNIKVATMERFPVNVTLIDPVGRPVFRETFPAESSAGGVRLNIDGKLTGGIYFIRVIQGRQSAIQKVIIRN